MCQGRRRRLAYLPEGRWQPFFNLEGRGEVAEGGQHVIAVAPLGTVPMWLREGGALALTEPALHTSTANWERLTWHVHVGERVEAHLYEDAGEGYGEARVTRLRGGLVGGRFVLERSMEGVLPLARDMERLRLYGLPAPGEVVGAREHRVRDGVLEVTVEAGWQRLEVRP